ncbi:MAG TPA: hypothetical protein VLY04_10270 [Bryobacteraceae bacterium]|nr:hypothetical protein [Bryobacteraceae bacterium]
MNYRHLALHCNCGEIPEHIAEVGFTEDHQLVVHWWCTQCQKLVYISKPLTDCWRECPTREQSLEYALPRATGGTYEKEDAAFLRSIGVRV